MYKNSSSVLLSLRSQKVLGAVIEGKKSHRVLVTYTQTLTPVLSVWWPGCRAQLPGLDFQHQQLLAM